MHHKPIVASARPLLLACLALALLTGTARAQLMINMTLEKKSYVAHEPIDAIVTVKNLAGHDLILSGPGGGGWLNFDIRRGNRGLSRRADAPTIRPYALKAGATVTKTISLGMYYPLGLPSDYAITANVYYPPLKQFFSSKRLTISVSSGKNLWTMPVGVPQGNNRPIQFRKYALLSHRDGKRSNLYVRVSAKDDSRIYATYSIGNVLRSFDPQIDIDGANRLHVLHLGAPQMYAHTVIDTDGNRVRQDVFKETAGSRPQLKNQSGTIVVRGGRKVDPNNPSGRPSIASQPGDDKRIRSGTERPEGLPLPR